MTLRRSIPWIFLCVCALIAAEIIFASSANAQMLYPGCSGIDCQFCNLMLMADKAIKYLLFVAVPIAALLFAYAGFLYMSSGGNEENIGKAKSIFKNLIIGFIIALLGFLIVDTVLQSVGSGTFRGPSWRSIQCVSSADRQLGGRGLEFGGSLTPYVNQGQLDPTNPGGVVVVPNPGTPEGVAQALAAYQGQSTSAGPGGGTVACAWAINNILVSAGMEPIDNNWVPSMEAQLQSGRGTPVSASIAQPGDIVIQGNQGHVGMCLNAGCTQVQSNSSSNASFSWVSNTDFGTGQPSRIYRVRS